MLLTLSEEHKTNLHVFETLSSEVAVEFCNVAIQSAIKGFSMKIFNSAAQKLGVDTQVVQRCVEALLYLYLEAAKHQLNEIDFEDSLLSIAPSEDVRKAMVHLYMENRTVLSKSLEQMSVSTTHYKDMSWRFDVQVASRHLRHQVSPLIVMKLDTTGAAEGSRSHFLQTDPVNLEHLTQSLEEALQQMKTPYVQRMLRTL